MTSKSEIGFAVIYRWKLREGLEDRFRQAWETVTLSLRDQRGARGSRLHRAGDGTWVAYAQWPDRQTWERSRGLGSTDPAASTEMREAVEQSFEPILLDPVCDHLR